VSQLTLSTHADSPAEEPPKAVPSQATPGPVVLTVPEDGLAASAPRWADGRRNTPTSAITSKEQQAERFTAVPCSS